MKNFIGLSFIVFFLTSACAEKDVVFKTLPTGPIKHHLIVLAKTKDGVKARGFAGATPANTKIFCEAGASHDSAVSSADGSFSVSLNARHSIDKGEFTFTVGDKIYQQAYDIKSLPEALQKIAKPAFNTDKEIDSIDFAHNQVAILSAEASLVRTFLVDDQWQLNEKAQSALLLNKNHNVALGGRMIQNIGDFIIAPLFNTHEIALMDQSLQRVVDKEPLKDPNGKLYRFDVRPPLSVQDPIDAAGSGVTSRSISQTTARNAEAVIALDDKHLLASFVNYYQFASLNQSAVVGPGIVALMAIDNLSLTTKAHVVVPFKNPSIFLKKDDFTVWVLCSGIWKMSSNNQFTSDDAGLVRLSIAKDFTSITIAHQIPLANFAPATPALVGNNLIIPHSFNNEILVIDENASSLMDEHKKTADYHRKFNFTFATHWHDDVAFLGDAQGTLVAYSVREGFFPFPFIEPIVIDKTIGSQIMPNPVNLYFRHEVNRFSLKEHYPTGYNAWVTSAMHKIYPLDFLSVFGP